MRRPSTPPPKTQIGLVSQDFGGVHCSVIVGMIRFGLSLSWWCCREWKCYRCQGVYVNYEFAARPIEWSKLHYMFEMSAADSEAKMSYDRAIRITSWVQACFSRIRAASSPHVPIPLTCLGFRLLCKCRGIRRHSIQIGACRSCVG